MFSRSVVHGGRGLVDVVNGMTTRRWGVQMVRIDGNAKWETVVKRRAGCSRREERREGGAAEGEHSPSPSTASLPSKIMKRERRKRQEAEETKSEQSNDAQPMNMLEEKRERIWGDTEQQEGGSVHE